MATLPPLSFADWQQLGAAASPAAAREVMRRVETLSPAQRRAIVAWLPSEETLTREFSSARGPLCGVPYFLKDLFDLAGVPTLGGSTFLPEVRPPGTQDGALPRALRQAGAVCAGKAHLHEFAYGLTGENPHYGDCEHPRFPGRTTGGSSSGSAAAVAAGIVPLAIATDTGGSARLPAAFCGLFGFRLNSGHPWIADAFPLAPSCDAPGWFTARADDLLTTNQALVGTRTSQREPLGCYLEFTPLEPEIAAACRAGAERLHALTDSTITAELTAGFAHVLETYNVLTIIEAWEVHKPWADRYRDHYDPAVWQRLNRVHTLTGEQCEIAELRRTALRLLWTKFFLAFDFLVMPVAPFAALKKEDFTPENRGRILTLAAPASLGGLPVLTLPLPLPSGLSAGLQVVVNNIQSPVISWALSRWQDAT